MNKTSKIVAGVLAFVCLFRFPVPAGSMRLSFQLIAEAGTVAIFALMLYRVNKWAAAFLVLSCFSMFFPQYDTGSFLAFNAVFYATVWYYFVTTVENAEPIMNVMAAVVVINVVALVLQAFDICPFFQARNGAGDIMTGLMANQNETSALIAFCSPVFFKRGRRWGLPIVLLGLALSRSFGGVLAFVAGAAYYYMEKEHLKNMLFIGVVVLSLALLIDTPTVSQRAVTWERGLDLWSKHAVFGSGVGHWKYIFMSPKLAVGGANMIQAHNEFLQGLFELGILFPVIMVGYASHVFKNRKIDRSFISAIIIIAVNSFVNFPFHVAITAYVAVTWMALLDGGVQHGHNASVLRDA